MVLRAVISFLTLALVWTFGIPGRVEMDEDADPDRWADAMGIPEVFDEPTYSRAYGIDPAPHRAGIERIETILYRRGPTGFGDAEAVESGAARVADALLRTDGLRGREAGMLLLGFAGRVGARAGSGYTLPSVVGMREEWEALRASVFQPADWMRTADPQLDLVQEPPPPPLDPRADAVILEVESELRRLLASGQRQVERLGEPIYDPDVPGRSDQGQIAAWHRFGERWRRQLDDAVAPIAELAPPPDAEREPLRAEAVRALAQAHDMLRRVPDGVGMWPTPFRPAWESYFRAASDALFRARHQMAEATGAAHAGRDHSRWNR
jgi:hypothetical protein